MSENGYIVYPIETDPDALTQDAIDYIQSVYATWQAGEGNLDVRILRSIASMAAEMRDVASDVPDAIYRDFGRFLANTPPDSSVAATGEITIVFGDDLGHTLEAGTQITFTKYDVGYAFAIDEEATVDPGDDTLSGIAVTAIETGEDSNDVDGDGVLVDALEYVDTVTLDDATSGGVDEEETVDYMDRLRGVLQLFSPRLILARDVEIMAMNVPGVHRALAIDGYNADDLTSDNEKTVTVALTDEDGSDVSATALALVLSTLESEREIGFNMFAIDPMRTVVNVTFTAKSYANYSASDVQTRAEEAVSDYLDPANWGTVPFGDDQQWLDEDTVRYNDIVSVIDAVEGLKYVTAVSINGGLAGVDLTLTGPAALPTVGTIAGTVTSV